MPCHPGTGVKERGRVSQAEREKDAKRGRERGAGYLPGPIGRGREPHLNLPGDVTTPRHDAGPMGGRHGQRRGRGKQGWAALRQLAESCGRRGRPGSRAGGGGRRPPQSLTRACPKPHARHSHCLYGAEF